MYRINPLSKNVLITTDEVINQVTTKHTLDVRMIENSIIIAEERFIRPALGYTYYEALIAEKNLTITSGNKAAQQALIDEAQPDSKPNALKEGDVLNASEYLSADSKALWNQVLWKLTAECVILMALSEGYVQFGSAGAFHQQSAAGPMSGEGIVTPELRSMKWAMDKKMMDRIDPLRETLHAWLCTQQKADSTKYTLYTKHCDCDVNGVAYKRKTDIIMGIYNDRDRNYPYNRDPDRHPACDCDDDW